MPGYGDYAAEFVLNLLLQLRPPPIISGVWIGLFNVPPADNGTGGTEVSGNGYARVQAVGTLTTNAAISAGGSVLRFASVPSWVKAGMTVIDATSPGVIQTGTTVIAISGNFVTLSTNVFGVGLGDTIIFSAWPSASSSSGSEPVGAISGTGLTFPMATGAGWGTVSYYGQFDAANGGHYLAGDYLGGYAWVPATMTSAAPGVITSPAHGYLALDTVVVTTKYAGSLPTVVQGSLTGPLTVLGSELTNDSFSVASGSTIVNTSTSGSFLVRKIVPQIIPVNIIAFFPASYFVAEAA